MPHFTDCTSCHLEAVFISIIFIIPLENEVHRLVDTATPRLEQRIRRDLRVHLHLLIQILVHLEQVRVGKDVSAIVRLGTCAGVRLAELAEGGICQLVDLLHGLCSGDFLGRGGDRADLALVLILLLYMLVLVLAGPTAQGQLLYACYV